MHATATLKMAKSRTKLRNIWQKAIYFYTYYLSHLLLPISFNNCPVLRIEKTELNAAFRENSIFDAS